MVMAYRHGLVRSMANPAWSAGVMGASYKSSMAGIVGQIVQWLCHVQFQHVPFYAACYRDKPTATVPLASLSSTNSSPPSIINSPSIASSPFVSLLPPCLGQHPSHP